MNHKLSAMAVALAAAFALPSLASAQFILDTGTPAGGTSYVLSTAGTFAVEFSATAGQTIGTLSAYLTQGAGEPGDTFTYAIYSGAPGNTFLSRYNSREASIFTATGTFETNGWNSTSVSWTPTTTGDYWLALQVLSTADTHGLDLPDEASTSTGTVPAVAFAYASSVTGQYSTASGEPFGIEISAAPEPSTWALMLGGVGLLAFWRMRARRA